LQASAQSRTFVVPAVVQMVIVPSPLHWASVPVQAGKQLVIAGDVDDIRSAQLAAARASAHVPVTRMAENCRRHASMVADCLHSVIKRPHSFSESIGRRVLGELPDEDAPLLDELELELDDEDDEPVPG
jgi:hypothetical protein